MTEERVGVIEVEGRMKKQLHVLVFELASDDIEQEPYLSPRVRRMVWRTGFDTVQSYVE